MLEAERGEHLDDDALISALCNSVLDGGGDAARGRARFQILTTVCEVCSQGWQQGAGSKQAAALPVDNIMAYARRSR